MLKVNKLGIFMIVLFVLLVTATAVSAYPDPGGCFHGCDTWFYSGGCPHPPMSMLN